MSSTVLKIGLGWSAFVGSHLVLSHYRQGIIDRIGKKRYLGLYSLTALATMAVPTVYYFAKGRNIGPQVLPKLKYVSIVFYALGSSFFGHAIFAHNIEPPNADSVETEKTENEKQMIEVTGVLRITRHPVFASLGMIGIGNMFATGMLGPVVYWSGYPLMYLIGCWHQDLRLRNQINQYYYQKTSLLPFGAILSGRNSVEMLPHELSLRGWFCALPVFFLCTMT